MKEEDTEEKEGRRRDGGTEKERWDGDEVSLHPIPEITGSRPHPYRCEITIISGSSSSALEMPTRYENLRARAPYVCTVSANQQLI